MLLLPFCFHYCPCIAGACGPKYVHSSNICKTVHSRPGSAGNVPGYYFSRSIFGRHILRLPYFPLFVLCSIYLPPGSGVGALFPGWQQEESFLFILVPLNSSVARLHSRLQDNRATNLLHYRILFLLYEYINYCHNMYHPFSWLLRAYDSPSAQDLRFFDRFFIYCMP